MRRAAGWAFVAAALLAPGRDGGAGPAVCPDGMVSIEGQFCIDRYEASLMEVVGSSEKTFSPTSTVGGKKVRAVSRGGWTPQGYISGREAAAACSLSQKRLCSPSEWKKACMGPGKTTYPYGASYKAKACNEGRTPHPVVQYFGTSQGVWDTVHMNNPGINQQADTVAKNGAYSDCTNGYGLFDMVGNMHEWVADDDGVFQGGFYVDAKINGNGCSYRTTKHDTAYHDYSTGFRCCSALTE